MSDWYYVGNKCTNAVAQLRLSSGFWQPWEGDAGFEVYSGADATQKIFDKHDVVILVRRGTDAVTVTGSHFGDVYVAYFLACRDIRISYNTVEH